MDKDEAERRGLDWIAEIGATAWSPARTPPCRTSRPAPSGRPARRPASSPTDLDLVEINEAFAAVGIAVDPRRSGIDEDIVNVNGGAIALGHPIGMSGARLVLHLALELQRRGGGTGRGHAVRRRRPGRRPDA